MVETDDTEPCPPPSEPTETTAWTFPYDPFLPEAGYKPLVMQRKCPSCEEWFIEGPDICPFCGRHLP